MELHPLGSSGLRVSRLCFGTLTIGPLQANLPLEQGVSLLVEAYQRGVNFFDTAESYRTYPFLRELIARVGRSSVVVATKSYAATAEEAERALHQALAELQTDYIDIFLLHEQLSEATLRGHDRALQYYLRAKKQGFIRAVGLSSHHIAAVRAAILREDIDIVHALYNRDGFGIQDGSAEEMLRVIEENHLMGKGIYAMKVLGGGHLIPDYRACLAHVAGQACLQSIAVGMQSVSELKVNIALLSGEDPEYDDTHKLDNKTRSLHIEDYCQACGLCVMRCPTKALKLTASGLEVDRSRCFTCGYCGRACPHFALKVL